jgi:ADP-ribose pyrophosphatase YjhB (NUDIX family)
MNSAPDRSATGNALANDGGDPQRIRLRDAARVIVFDPADRILLVRFTKTPGDSIWSMPGGGVEPGETHLDAAERELAEETGVRHGALIGPVWIRTAIFDLIPGYDGQLEHYFTTRAAGPSLTPAMTHAELAAERMAGMAWWTLDQIAASRARFAPFALPSLLGALVEHGPPTEPLQIGN